MSKAEINPQLFQIRYYNPKTRQFYYHNAHHPWLSTMSPAISQPSPGGAAAGLINSPNNVVLAGEPETFSDLSQPFYQMVRRKTFLIFCCNDPTNWLSVYFIKQRQKDLTKGK